jgi:hypothetical protein
MHRLHFTFCLLTVAACDVTIPDDLGLCAIIQPAVLGGSCAGQADSTGSGGSGGDLGVEGLPCDGEPWSCPLGTTCESDGNGGPLTCKPSGPGKKGDSCMQGPEPECGDGLFCGVFDSGYAYCVPTCRQGDAEHTCEPGENCTDGSPGLCMPS